MSTEYRSPHSELRTADPVTFIPGVVRWSDYTQRLVQPPAEQWYLDCWLRDGDSGRAKVDASFGPGPMSDILTQAALLGERYTHLELIRR